MAYLIDSNIFIQAKRTYYQMSFCTAFWDLIITLHNQGKVYSINKVKQELTRGEDELSEWAKTLPSTFWIDEEQYSEEYGKIINWAYQSKFTDTAKLNFAEHSRADAWLIATAAAKNMTIITHETRADPNVKRLVKIPNAAEIYGIPCITIYEFLAEHSHSNFTPKP